MQLSRNPEQGRSEDSVVQGVTFNPGIEQVPFFNIRFGVTQTSAGSSRSSMENGRRDQGQGPESDEDDDHQQNTPDTGR